MSKHNSKGFTLIELIIVMSIVVLLTTMVGPLAIRNLEKAQAKSELLSLKNWIDKISYRAYISSQKLDLIFRGKQVVLQSHDNTQIIKNQQFEFLFFQPQTLSFNRKGFVSPDNIEGLYRDNSLNLDLSQSINFDYGVDSEK